MTEVIHYVWGIHKCFLVFLLDTFTLAIKTATIIIMKPRLPTLTHSEARRPESPVAQTYVWSLV
jgi:hypothetical protein